MWRRPVVTILMLIIAVILTRPLRAQQENVALGFSPAPHSSRSRQPSQIRFSNPLGAALKDGVTTPGTGPAKPFTQEQVVSMVRDGFGDDSGAKMVEQREIDFAPAR